MARLATDTFKMPVPEGANERTRSGASLGAFETLLVLVVVAGISNASGGSIKDWMIGLSILIGFLYSQLAFDISEYKIMRQGDYYALKLKLLFIAKEAAWFATFLYMGTYPMLAGSFVFILYPGYRKMFRNRGQSTNINLNEGLVINNLACGRKMD